MKISGMVLGAVCCCGVAGGQRVEVQRGNATVLVESYAANIVRVSLSLDQAAALRGPGVGVSAGAVGAGWTQTSGAEGEVLRSSAMRVEISPERKRQAGGRGADIASFFHGGTPATSIRFSDGSGKTLLRMQGWAQSVPNHKDGNTEVLRERRPGDDPFFEVSASFDAPEDEHYFGLGQNQEGFLDLRGHSLTCAHDYRAAAGPSACVPFIVSNKGYALLWDNPSKTRVDFAYNEQTHWRSEVGQRVSFFVITGAAMDDLYRGYRLLTGDVPMLPRSAYGYIQCKQRYSSQKDLLDAAHGYRDRNLPADVMVVDWFYFTKMGQMDMDPRFWPDPKGMNDELHKMGFHSMISVWPRFVPEDRYYATLKKNNWFVHLADGTPEDGLPYDQAGSDVDTTNADAARWFWGIVKDNFVSLGFDSFWADETEPDLAVNDAYYSIGPGTEYFNVYPYFHTKALYDGFRRDLPRTRALILARDGFTGAQHNGTIFWSSDIAPTWDTLKRQVPTGLNFVASGMPYWSTDIGGWQDLPAIHKAVRPVLLDDSDARENVGGYEDYAELYTRWFEYATFQPNMRAHGSREHNEVWSFGKAAEPILEKYLRLRYQLMPYLYSLGHATHESGAPFMRGLFLDFTNDPQALAVTDEYMFGPALLVAPVTEQGRTEREVYLPAGTDWYDFWTNKRYHGGQRMMVPAPIDTLPLFVRAGSILPMGGPISSTEQKQAIAEVRVYAGADGRFGLYNDDGKTYAYEQGTFDLTQLRWSDAEQRLTQSGPRAWTDDAVIHVVR